LAVAVVHVRAPERLELVARSPAARDLRSVQIILGHSKIENAVRFLGIDVEDALALAENTEI
jgi:hypothetical protein